MTWATKDKTSEWNSVRDFCVLDQDAKKQQLFREKEDKEKIL